MKSIFIFEVFERFQLGDPLRPELLPLWRTFIVTATRRGCPLDTEDVFFNWCYGATRKVDRLEYPIGWDGFKSFYRDSEQIRKGGCVERGNPDAEPVLQAWQALLRAAGKSVGKFQGRKYSPSKAAYIRRGGESKRKIEWIDPVVFEYAPPGALEFLKQLKN